MSLQDIKNAKKLKSKNLTRAQIAERALEICKQAVEHGGYKNAIGAIGRMQALRQCINDSYWDERRLMGYEYEYYYQTCPTDTHLKDKALEN